MRKEERQKNEEKRSTIKNKSFFLILIPLSNCGLCLQQDLIHFFFQIFAKKQQINNNINKIRRIYIYKNKFDLIQLEWRD